MPKPDSSVFGVLLDVDEQTLGLLDLKEGHPERYSRCPSPSSYPSEGWCRRQCVGVSSDRRLSSK